MVFSPEKNRGDFAEDSLLVSELQELINDVRVTIMGPIRQELLSGISTKSQFDALKEHLEAFEDQPFPGRIMKGRQNSSIHAANQASRAPR